MIKAVAIAVAAAFTLALWVLKRYFARGDALRRLKKERRAIRREMAKTLRSDDIDKWHTLHDQLWEINKQIHDLPRK